MLVSRDELSAALASCHEDDGIPQTKIADGSGVSLESIKAFRRSGTLGEDNRAKLAAWLAERGYLNAPERAKEKPAPYNARSQFQLLAGDLRQLADWLDSPDISEHAKQQKIRALIRDIFNVRIIDPDSVSAGNE